VRPDQPDLRETRDPLASLVRLALMEQQARQVQWDHRATKDLPESLVPLVLRARLAPRVHREIRARPESLVPRDLTGLLVQLVPWDLREIRARRVSQERQGPQVPGVIRDLLESLVLLVLME